MGPLYRLILLGVCGSVAAHGRKLGPGQRGEASHSLSRQVPCPGVRASVLLHMLPLMR